MTTFQIKVIEPSTDQELTIIGESNFDFDPNTGQDTESDIEPIQALDNNSNDIDMEVAEMQSLVDTLAVTEWQPA